MQFSKTFRASSHCIASPDGNYIATLFANVINVRTVRSLEVDHVVKLAQDFAGPILGFRWSPSSTLLLAASVDLIQVCSALGGDGSSNFDAIIRNPVTPGTRPAHVDFGASDTEICLVSSFGLKFSIFNLTSSDAIEIANPKFSSPSTATRGFSFRPGSRHLALLTRSAGKDVISIHDYPARRLQISWAPDTVDAQGIVWSPDGRWLVVWESPALGHKVIFYTPDGHIFKVWKGPANPALEDRDYELGAGVKFVSFSRDARLLAIGDCSKSISMFNMMSAMEGSRLQHPNSIVPKDSLQVWQEKIVIAQTGPSIHTFIRTSQMVSPAPRPQDSNSEILLGCADILFDPFSTLLATRLEDYPSTVWIWDLQGMELRAVLLFHGDVSKLSWHPTVRETLLIRCEGDQYSRIVFVWDPLSEGPRSVDFAQYLPGGKTVGRWRASWLGLDEANPISLILSDSQNCMLASLPDHDQVLLPWSGHPNTGNAERTTREESPLELVPADEVDDNSELEDTFVYKK
ncbi:WD40 repeat-like protein [Rhypophila sp. PSN 637]